MKHIRLILQTFVCVVLAAYALLVFAVGHPRVQGWLAEAAERQVEEMLQTEVQIGYVELGLFNAVALHDVTLNDRLGHPMFRSGLVYAKLKFLPLLKGRVFLRNIVVLDADISLYRRSENENANFQFVIDSFKSKDAGKRRTALTVNSLIFRRCRVAYEVHGFGQRDKQRFNPRDIMLDAIDANVSLKEFSDDSLNVRVRNLSFREQSGIVLNELKFHLTAGRRKAVLRDLSIRTPYSRITQDTLIAQYDSRNRGTFLQTLAIKGSLQEMTIGLDDLAPFVPAIKSCGIAMHLAADIKLSGKSVMLHRLHVSDIEEDRLQYLGNITMEADRHGDIDVRADIRTFNVASEMVEKVYEDILKRPVPTAIIPLGDLAFKGKVNFLIPRNAGLHKSRGALNGVLASGAGNVSLCATYNQGKMMANLATADFLTSGWGNHRFMPQTASLEMKLQATVDELSHFEHFGAELQVFRTVINAREYSDITAQVVFSPHERLLSAHLQSDNSGARVSANMRLACPRLERVFKDVPECLTVDADIMDFNPKQLNITDRYHEGTFSMKAKAGILYPASLQKLEADITVTDFKLEGDSAGLGPYCFRSLSLKTNPCAKGQHVTLRSDFADFEYEGPVQKKELESLCISTLTDILNGEKQPAEAFVARNRDAGPHAASFVLSFKDAEVLRRIARLDIRQQGTLNANGHIGHCGETLSLSVIAPELSFGNFNIAQLSLFAFHHDNHFSLLAKAVKDMRNGRLQAELTMKKAVDGRIATDIDWRETQHDAFYGKVSTVTRLMLPTRKSNGNTDENFTVETEILPTTMSLNDSIWNFEHAHINYAEGCIGIRNFGFRSGKQYMLVNGNYEQGATDPIVIDLQHLDLEYILALARLNVVEFGGHATGRVMVRQLHDGSPWASAIVNVPDLTFNRAPLGNGNVTITWDHPRRDILIDGDIREPGMGFTIVKGYVDPVHRNLDLQTESLNTQLGFINKYTEGIFENIKGRATGHCRIYGGFRSINFEGRERGHAEACIPVTGVTYKVENADIEIRPEAFVFNHAEIKDLGKGAGEVRGILAHNHIKHMRYDFSISGENLCLYDKPRELDMPFFATAYGSGNVRLHGSPGKMNAEMQLQTQPGSELTYILDSPDADVSQLLSIRPQSGDGNRDTVRTNRQTQIGVDTHVDGSGKTDINLYFEVNVDAQSCLHLVTDDKSGDAITVFGEGPIQANYHNKSGFKMFGTYNIHRGTYSLNIPMLAQRKKFDILPGGQVRFYGDPMTADVNVKARYVVNSASLADLNIGTGFANNTTRVDCLVNIYGEVANMQFELDFDLPNVSDDEKQMVHSLIASDEERTTQVLYLLGLGRFYAYNFNTNNTGQNQSTLMMNSLLSSTLSSQLNSIIANAMGSSNWTFGTNISTGQMGWNDTEVEGLVSSRLLDNRLLINGNFGYSNRQAATTNFVGDFDMQYLITPQGTVSIKAYSETNDRYFTKSSLTTQGVGLQLKRDFIRIADLFRRKRKTNSEK